VVGLLLDGNDDIGLSDGSVDTITLDWGETELLRDGDDDTGFSDGSAEAVTMASSTSIVPMLMLRRVKLNYLLNNLR
jgi:hypothetical protein